ncbi:MAG: beta-Ala-His dipeptidase, partial [Bacteroidales bacterium]|nr:beta-Ala-His dipeptidase [Bacteroidales bacterium]
MIQNLDPQIVWKNFYALTQIPRPSKHEEKVSQYLYEFGKKLSLETIRDKAGNVIIKKPATPGYENRKGVILQGHMDMVPQKTPDTVHDFLTDPIQTWIDGEWVKAKGTTLGADNGLGVALALSVLESKDIKHGPVEALFTVDEETGMTGAMVLAPGLLDGEILINCDSESEGQLCVGCAGGLDFKATDKYTPQPYDENDLCYTLAVKKCRGGHSGLEIHEYRCNANKALCRILYALLTQTDVKLLDMEGGSLRNAIPLASFSTIYIPKKSLADATEVVSRVFNDIKTEYAQTDPEMELVFEPCKCAEGEVCNLVTVCAWVLAG